MGTVALGGHPGGPRRPPHEHPATAQGPEPGRQGKACERGCEEGIEGWEAVIQGGSIVSERRERHIIRHHPDAAGGRRPEGKGRQGLEHRRRRHRQEVLGDDHRHARGVVGARTDEREDHRADHAPLRPRHPPGQHRDYRERDWHGDQEDVGGAVEGHAQGGVGVVLGDDEQEHGAGALVAHAQRRAPHPRPLGGVQGDKAC
mmetsp:Transcript_34262/g.84268  ORF Transcript_34262/g.84268 Transcript_34262/m.84268 type:complete len:202 (+) Transcript_34262:1790-2395(+)